jgi:DNA-binding transcriptional MocR family regulator
VALSLEARGSPRYENGMSPYLSLAFGGARSGQRFGAQEIVAAIAAQLRDNGAAVAGCRLPPIRVLAHRLGVSKNTVSVAYDELKARGLVASRAKLGLYVVGDPAERPLLRPAARVPAPEWKRWAGLSPAPVARAQELLLGSVFIDPRLLPRERLAACFRAVLKRPGLPEFSDAQGFAPLRRAIAKRLRQRGIEADPEMIVTTVGSQQVLDLVARSLRSRVVATEDPAYHLGKALLERHELELVGLRVDPFAGADLEAWREQLRARRPGLLYLTTHFQNPTGYSYSSLEIERILDWSREFRFGVLEDDWGSDMLSYSEFTPSLRALGGPHVLYMNSFTKKLLPALRIGYVVADPETAAALVAAKRTAVGAAPALGEAALYEFLEQGYYDAHLRALQPELDRRYRHCLELLRQSMPEGVRWTAPGGGPQLWVECPRSVDLPALAARLRERKVVLALSQQSFFGTPHLHGFKLGYAFLTPQEMERGIDPLSAELHRALAMAPVPSRERVRRPA